MLNLHNNNTHITLKGSGKKLPKLTVGFVFNNLVLNFADTRVYDGMLLMNSRTSVTSGHYVGVERITISDPVFEARQDGKKITAQIKK